MSKRLYAGILTILLIQITGSAQEPSHYDWGNFTPADSLRGYLSPLRTCYNVTYYHLDITVDTAGHSIRGSNAIWFKVAFPFDSMQVDLFPNMKVDSILYFAEGVSASDGEDGNLYVMIVSLEPCLSICPIRWQQDRTTALFSIIPASRRSRTIHPGMAASSGNTIAKVIRG